MRFRSFSLPSRDRRRVHPISKTRDETCSNELTETERRALDRGANDHDRAADENGPFTSEHISEPDGGDSSEEAAQSVAADSDTLDIRGLTGGASRGRARGVDFRKDGEERWKRQETSHYTLVVSKKRKIRPRNHRNGDVEFGARQAIEFLHLGGFPLSNSDGSCQVEIRDTDGVQEMRLRNKLIFNSSKRTVQRKGELTA